MTNIATAPYGELLPLYSAYVAFCALSEDVKKAIVDETRNKKVSAPAEVTQATSVVKAMFAS